MIGEDILSQAAAKAARAQQLLDNELLSEAFTALESTYTTAWRSTMIDEVSAREKLFLAINVVGKVRDHLKFVVDNGKVAARELKDLADLAERQKTWSQVRG